MLYENCLKKEICEKICFNGNSTIKTAKNYDIPLKTIEKWITAFRKDPHCFDNISKKSDHFILSQRENALLYDEMSNDELKKILMKKDIEITRLKKGYMVKGGGMEKKEFVTFFKKNMK